MLFGQFNCDLVQNVSGISLQSGKKGATTINNDETEFLIVFKEIIQTGGMELILAFIQERCCWSEWLDIESNLLFCFVIFHQDLSAENNQTICWGCFPKLQLFSGRGDSALDRGHGLLGFDLSCLSELFV